jgi:hypothetical protein
MLKWGTVAILFPLALGIMALFIAYWRSTNDCEPKAAAPANPMKAIRYCEYGAPDDVLKLEQVEEPVLNDDQTRVRVRAVSLRFFDGGMLQGGSADSSLDFASQETLARDLTSPERWKRPAKT